MNEQEIQKLRDAGFTDNDIREYMDTQPGLSSQPTAVRATEELDPTAPSETLARAQAAGVATEGRPSSFLSDVVTAAPVLAGQYIEPITYGLAGAYSANQLRKGLQSSANRLLDQRLLAPQMAPQLAPQMAPPPAASQILGPNGQPMRPMGAPTAPAPMAAPAPTAPAPMAPPTAPAAAAPTSWMQKALQMAGTYAPAVAIAAPYMAASSRVSDIQARPNAPEYATNPRAMAERSGGQMTPAQAGELNRRRAAAGFWNR